MAAALRSQGVEFEEVDVESDPELESRYGEHVPVLLDAGGQELCRHRLTPEAVRRLR